MSNNSKSLFHIAQEFAALENDLFDSGGELTPELEQALRINREELYAKAIAYHHIIKSAEYSEAAVDAEIKRLQQIKKGYGSVQDRLKESLKTAMELYQVEKIEHETARIFFRKSTSVEILDEEIIPAGYSNKKIVITPDKTAIKKAIESGEAVPGACLKENKNLQLK